MTRYWKYINPYLPAFIIGPMLMIVEVIGEVVMPWLWSHIIDDGIYGNRGISYIIFIGIIMLLTALLMMAGGIGGAYFAIKASSGFANDLRKDLFKKIQQFQYRRVQYRFFNHTTDKRYYNRSKFNSDDVAHGIKSPRNVYRCAYYGLFVKLATGTRDYGCHPLTHAKC